MIQSLLQQFEDASVRGRILIASGNINLAKSDYEGCLQTLRDVSIEYGVDHFIRSRQMMATIYLTKFKDRTNYVECYK